MPNTCVSGLQKIIDMTKIVLAWSIPTVSSGFLVAGNTFLTIGSFMAIGYLHYGENN